MTEPAKVIRHPSSPGEPFVKVKVVAELLDLDPATVYRWAIKGKIPSHELGPRTRRFRLSEVERWASNTMGS